MSTRDTGKLRVLSALVLLTMILTSVGMAGSVLAQDGPPPPEVEVVNEYYTLIHHTLEDGTQLERAVINGPSAPIAGEDLGLSHEPLPVEGVLAGFPSYSWVFGCTAVSGAMIAGYYDRTGYPDMYTGPTNNGKMILSDTVWPTWTDVNADTYPNNPLIASHKNVDGRTTKGSIDDYWVQYGSTANDPYVGNWTEHTWSDAIGDYMKTSQSKFPYQNTDGSSSIWNYTSSNTKLTCTAMETANVGGYMVSDDDANYGRKEFSEARGYSVNECWNQKTYNQVSGGFSLADLQAYLDKGIPVLIHVVGHSMVAYGYSGSTVYIRNTWDNDPSTTYTMVWDATPSYSGMNLDSVSILTLDPVRPQTRFPRGPITKNRPRFYWTKVAGAERYQVQLWQGGTRVWWRTVWSPSCSADLCRKKWWIPIPDGSYMWRVRAHKDGVWGPWSWKRWFSVTTP